MTPAQARMIREIHHANGLVPGAPHLIDGPRRGKIAAAMAALGWLEDCGPIGAPVPIGRGYKLTPAGIVAYNDAIVVKAE